MSPLLEALLLKEPQARQAWTRWRAGIDINALSYTEQLLFAALNPALPEWLENDSAAGIFQGIVRRIWSQNQLRMRKAVELDSLLKEAGVQAAIAGPLRWSLRTPPPAIRAIPHLTFVAARADIQKATDTLQRAGWEQYGDVPPQAVWDWCDHVSFHRHDLQVNLHWRLVPVPPEDAAECEMAFLALLSPFQSGSQSFRALSREATLLHILCCGRDHDLPWQADVALTGVAGIDWGRFLKLARRFGPLAIERLRELRSFPHLAIPELPLDNSGLFRRKVHYFWNAYRAHCYHQKQALSWSGFARFLALRWNLPHVWAVPFAGAKRVFHLRRSVLR